MHRIQFREIMRDAEVAHAIHPIVLKYLLTVEETTKALLACGVSRAANVAQISTGRSLSTNMQLTAQQSSAIYFKRPKGSKGCAFQAASRFL